MQGMWPMNAPFWVARLICLRSSGSVHCEVGEAAVASREYKTNEKVNEVATPRLALACTCTDALECNALLLVRFAFALPP